MDKIIFLPLDERPCNYIYPEYIGRISGMDVRIVPKELMGNFKNPADIEKIWEWTREEVKEASVLIISMDLFLYGGIVPSRLHHITEKKCQERIQRIRTLKEENPNLKIFAFQLITRAPARNGSGEEPDYYEKYGFRLYRYGVLRDKERLELLDGREKVEKTQIEEEIPRNILADFLNRREINFHNNQSTVDLVSDGMIDFLVVPLDDCRQYGYAPAERRKLASYAAGKDLFSKIYFYPGADEVGCTLLARAINTIKHKTPRIFVDYSSLRGQFQIPSYEDRSIGETVQYQLLAAGCEIAEISSEADGILIVNPPTEFSLRLEKELITDEIFLETERNLQALTARIQKYLRRKQVCAIADCAIPNMADKALMQFLYEQKLLNKIDAYAGWNTSSNTLGTVIAHLTACCCHPKESETRISEEFRFLRYMEDWGYMAEVRRKVTENLPTIDSKIHSLDLGDKAPEVSRIIKLRLEQFQKRYFPENARKFDIHIPWNRMFEIEIELK